jgi:hypothetical protein
MIRQVLLLSLELKTAERDSKKPPLRQILLTAKVQKSLQQQRK